MLSLRSIGLRRILDKPPAIQSVRVVFVSTGEIPPPVPNLRPGVVPVLRRPIEGARSARRHSDTAARIDIKNRQPRASRPAFPDRLRWALVRLLPARVVVHIH